MKKLLLIFPALLVLTFISCSSGSGNDNATLSETEAQAYNAMDAVNEVAQNAAEAAIKAAAKSVQSTARVSTTGTGQSFTPTTVKGKDGIGTCTVSGSGSSTDSSITATVNVVFSNYKYNDGTSTYFFNGTETMTLSISMIGQTLNSMSAAYKGAFDVTVDGSKVNLNFDYGMTMDMGKGTYVVIGTINGVDISQSGASK